jgi:omega-6 fatty acid desaturase (delta-12 desaturase)
LTDTTHGTTPAEPKRNDHGPSLGARFAAYRHPHLGKSLWQLANSAALFAGTWAGMYLLLDVSYWLSLALAVPAAFFLIRLFIIQHDCGHGAFFKSQKLADLVGGLIGVLSLTPYAYWRKTHALHHATSGNLEHRGFGDIDTLTIREYLALSRWERFKYRLYRHPLVLFGVGPAFHFLVKHRIPAIVPRSWRRERRSILRTNFGIATLLAAAGLTLGFREVLLVQLPITLITCSIGVWLFYVQHQFENTYWEHEPAWSYDDAALHGSSYLELPALLRWATGNIGLHHIHHCNARIPNYRLPEVLRDHPELSGVSRLTLWQSITCARLALWDEARRRLVGFREARRLAVTGTAAA